MKLSTLSIISFVCIATVACDQQQPVTAVATLPAVISSSEPRYEASLEQGIDFRKAGLPTFVQNIEGVSGVEDWGRWSDANLTPSVKINFTNSLTHKVTVELRARGIFENVKLPTRMLIGGVEKTFTLSEKDETFILQFDLPTSSNQIEIIPPRPESANHVGGSSDTRLLGIGLVSLKIFVS